MSDEPTFTMSVLDEHGLLTSRQLPDGRWLTVQPLLFGQAQIGITRDAGTTLGEALEVADFGAYDDVWHYATAADAIAAMDRWAFLQGEGEPDGWTRHPSSGRKRVGDGTIVFAYGKGRNAD